MRWHPKPSDLPDGEHWGFALFPTELWTGEIVWLEWFIWREYGPYRGIHGRSIERRMPGMEWAPAPGRGLPPPKK